MGKPPGTVGRRSASARARIHGRARGTAHVQIGVDIGGTFTDIVALDERGRLVLTKVPSTPKDLLESIALAVRRVLAQAGASASAVEPIIQGTTRPTNSVLGPKGAHPAKLPTWGLGG